MDNLSLDNDTKKEAESSHFAPRFFNPRNDVAFKKVFVNHEDMTLSFLNSVLRLEEKRKIKTVEFLPTERLPLTAEAKKSILDVLCTDENGSQYIIEVQNKSMLNYIQRAQYYASHLYAGQLQYAEDYLKLKPVTMLSILNHSIFPHEVNYLSFHHNIEKETKVSYLDDMYYVFVELPKFNKKLEDLETLEDYWIFTMKEGDQLTEVPQSAPEEVKKAYGILEKHTWTREERRAYEQAKIGLMDDMEAIRTARIEGEQIGLEKGEQIGLEKGKEEEKQKYHEEKKDMARMLLQEGMEIQKIAKITGLSVLEIDVLSSPV